MSHPRRRTVLYCNPFSQAISGADESLLALLHGLDRVRFRALVVLPAPSPYESRYRSLGVSVYHVPIYGIRRSWRRTLPYLASFAPAVLRLERLIQRERVDLVHANMSVVLQAGVGGRLAGIPTLYHLRSTSIARPRLAADALVRCLEVVADRLVAASELIAQIFRSRHCRRPIDVVHDGIVLDDFSNCAPIDTNPSKPRLIATMGRISPRKGYEHFIAAAAILSRRHPGLRFAIHGGTADRAEEDYLRRLQKQAQDAGLSQRLEFRGHRNDVAQAMSECDLFMMTSLDEGFGRVVVEAMAAGRPVIGSAIGGIRELIRGGHNGDLVPAADPQALADAASTYLDDLARLERHGQNARESASRLGATEHARRIEAIYDQMLRPR